MLEPCNSSTAGEIWQAGAQGSWVNPNSGMCLDDPSSTTTSDTQLQIWWCNGTGAQDWASTQASYDPDGTKSLMADATGTSSYGYDPFGELTSATNAAGQTISYSYDSDGDTTAITYPLPATATWATSDTATYGYDHADRLTSVTDFNSNTIGITDNADGNPTSETLGSTGDTIATGYDPSAAISSISLANSSGRRCSRSPTATPPTGRS